MAPDNADRLAIRCATLEDIASPVSVEGGQDRDRLRMVLSRVGNRHHMREPPLARSGRPLLPVDLRLS